MSQLLEDAYHLDEVVGRGPHGVVWRGRHRVTRDAFALKVLHAELARDPAVVDRFAREESVLRAFVHPAIVRVRELRAQAGSVFLETELVDGMNLGRALAAEGPFSAVTAVEVAAVCAEAIGAGHQAGVVHCGVKPTNVILTRGFRQPRITDSRVARLARQSTVPAGNDPTNAPEVRAGRTVGPPTDVYGLGILLSAMLTGSWPIPDGAPLTAAGPRLRDLVAACLAEDPDQRPTCERLAADLLELVTAGSAEPLLPPALDPPTRPAPARPGPPRRLRRAAMTSVAALATSAVLAAGVGWAASGRRAASGPPPAETPVAVASTGPEQPADALLATAAGAEAFVEYWFDTLTHATATGDTGPLTAASSPDCQPCANAVRSLRDAHAAGRSVRGGRFTVRSAHIDSFFDLSRPTLRVVFDRSPRSTLTVDGAALGSLPEATFASCQVILARATDRWLVLDVQSSDPVA